MRRRARTFASSVTNNSLSHNSGSPPDIPMLSDVHTILPSTDLHFELTLSRPLEVPFAGPTLRGMLGYGLRQTSCSHSSDANGHCSHGAGCRYAELFEGAPPEHLGHIAARHNALPQPMLLEIGSDFGAPQTSLVPFVIRLFGTARAHALLIAEAIHSRQRFGLGAGHVPFTITSFRSSPTPLAKIDDSIRHAIARPQSTLRWHFETPLSMRASHEHRTSINAIAFVNAARRRWWLMQAAFDDRQDNNLSDAIPEPLPPIESDFSIAWEHTRLWQIRRRSGRQQQQVPLEGLLGDVAITGNWANELPWLEQITRLHLGKYALFGLGKVRWIIDQDH